MNDLIQSILVAIAIIGSVAWIVIKVFKGASKSDPDCKDCPLAEQCANKRKCGNSSCNCGCK